MRWQKDRKRREGNCVGRGRTFVQPSRRVTNGRCRPRDAVLSSPEIKPQSRQSRACSCTGLMRRPVRYAEERQEQSWDHAWHLSWRHRQWTQGCRSGERSRDGGSSGQSSRGRGRSGRGSCGAAGLGKEVALFRQVQKPIGEVSRNRRREHPGTDRSASDSARTRGRLTEVSRRSTLLAPKRTLLRSKSLLKNKIATKRNSSYLCCFMERSSSLLSKIPHTTVTVHASSPHTLLHIHRKNTRTRRTHTCPRARAPPPPRHTRSTRTLCDSFKRY